MEIPDREALNGMITSPLEPTDGSAEVISRVRDGSEFGEFFEMKIPQSIVLIAAISFTEFGVQARHPQTHPSIPVVQAH